jgi:hypothetical protein
LDYAIQIIYNFEHLGEEWKAIHGRHDALDLWNAIVATHNAVSTGNNDVDRIKTRRHFETLRRGPDKTPLMFKDSLKKALNVMAQLGEATTGNTDSALLFWSVILQADSANPSY